MLKRDWSNTFDYKILYNNMLQLLDRIITDMKLEVITHSHALARYFDIELHALSEQNVWHVVYKLQV